MVAIIAILISLAVFVWGVLIAGGSLLMFWDLPSIIIAVGFDLGALLVSGQMKPFALGCKTLFTSTSAAPKSELLAAAETFDLMFKCSIGGGFIGLVMGLVMMMVNLSDTQHIGPYLAVAVITVLYGLMLSYLFFLPAKVKLVNLANR